MLQFRRFILLIVLSVMLFFSQKEVWAFYPDNSAEKAYQPDPVEIVIAPLLKTHNIT